MKKILKRTISLLLIFMLCFALCGCDTWNNFKKAFIDPESETVHTIKIGVLEPKSGRQSYEAEDELAGIELAYSLFNSIGDYKIELIVEDNHSDITSCADSAQRLIDDGCALIIGSYSDTLSLAASDTIKNAQIPAIAASCTVPILTQSNEYYFRASCINSYDTAGAADYIFYSLGQDRCVVFLQEDNDYQQNKADLFQEEFIDLCGNETIEFKIEEHDEESDSTYIKIEEIPSVRFVYITGEETEEDFEVLFADLEKYEYSAFYSTQSKAEAIAEIYSSFLHFEDEPVEEPQEPENPDEPSEEDGEEGEEDNKEEENSEEQEEEQNNPENPDETEDPSEDNPEDPENPEDPQEDDEPEVPTKHFCWIGTDLWSDIEEYALSNENYAKNFFLKYVSFTVDYDSLVSSSEMSNTMLKAYKEKYGEEASPSDLFALGFDAYLIAYNALIDTVEAVDGPLESNPLIDEDEEAGEQAQTETEDEKESDLTDLNSGNSSDLENDTIFKPKDDDTEVKLFDDDGVFNRSLLTEKLKVLKNVSAATGTISIDENGDPVKDILIKACTLPGYLATYSVVPGSEPIKIEYPEEESEESEEGEENTGEEDQDLKNE